MTDTDLIPTQQMRFAREVIHGLGQTPKTLPSRWLYDDQGCELYEAITQVEEYYPARTEFQILHEQANDIAAFIGQDATLIEYGSGASVKTRVLLDRLTDLQTYVPVDIAGDFLEIVAQDLQSTYPELRILPLTADFTHDFDLPDGLPKSHRRAFFPGSTIGNLSGPEAIALLRRMLRHTGSQGRAIIGADLKKDLSTLLAAYDDAEGITAAFNRNVLVRINRELNGNFDPLAFRHEARWNPIDNAVEMHLRSLCDQTVQIDSHSFDFRAGETIHTESSRKYDPASFGQLAHAAGWQVDTQWTDVKRRFALFGLIPAS